MNFPREATAQDWAARQAELLPVPYYHLVFTLPAAIGAVAYQTKAAVYDLLFNASAETLAIIAADRAGIRKPFTTRTLPDQREHPANAASPPGADLIVAAAMSSKRGDVGNAGIQYHIPDKGCFAMFQVSATRIYWESRLIPRRGFLASSELLQSIAEAFRRDPTAAAGAARFTAATTPNIH